MQQVTTIITDLDNTLWDWVAIWHSSFSAMLNEIVELSGVPRDTLLDEFRAIHQEHGTVEYAFSIEELPSLRAKHPGAQLDLIYRLAIDAYCKARNDAMRLYPTVSKTLHHLKSLGVRIIAFTESKEFYSLYRIRKLNLVPCFDYLYSPPDHDLPEGLTRNKIRRYPPQTYELPTIARRHIPANVSKPAPQILRQIVAEVDADSSRTIYIGDDLSKDVAMAQAANITDVHAQYGVAHEREEYALLKQVTHWTPEQVQAQRTTTSKHVNPSYALDESFAQLLHTFDFAPSTESGDILPHV